MDDPIARYHDLRRENEILLLIPGAANRLNHQENRLPSPKLQVKATLIDTLSNRVVRPEVLQVFAKERDHFHRLLQSPVLHMYSDLLLSVLLDSLIFHH